MQTLTHSLLTHFAPSGQLVPVIVTSLTVPEEQRVNFAVMPQATSAADGFEAHATHLPALQTWLASHFVPATWTMLPEEQRVYEAGDDAQGTSAAAGISFTHATQPEEVQVFPVPHFVPVTVPVVPVQRV